MTPLLLIPAKDGAGWWLQVVGKTETYKVYISKVELMEEGRIAFREVVKMQGKLI